MTTVAPAPLPPQGIALSVGQRNMSLELFEDDDRSEENSESQFGGDTDTLGSSTAGQQQQTSGGSSSSNNQQTSESLSPQEERALVQLQDALDCLVGNAADSSGRAGNKKGSSEIDCSSYLTACKKCPDILLNPSFRIPFLRRFGMDPWAAAKRMVTYWNERKFLFGEAAFRPLTISMLPDLFREASIVLLPHRDKEGRSVIFLDRLKLNYEQLRDDIGRARCVFYLLDLVAQQNPTASAQGIVILALVCKPPLYQTVPKANDVSWWDSFFSSFSNLYEWKFPKHCIRMVTQALPIQIAMIHFCTLPQSTGVGYLRTAAVNVGLNMVGSYFNNITKVHHGSKKPDSDGEEDDDPSDDAEPRESDQFSRLHQASLLKQLRPYGLFKKQLPQVVGGLFSYQNFEHWVQRHSSQEMRSMATSEELLRRKRQVNLVHSRQKRQRRRQEFDELNSQCEELKIENQQAKTETCRLEALLRQSNDIVKKLERGEVPGLKPSAAGYKSSPVAAPVTSFAGPAFYDSQHNLLVGQQLHAHPLIEPVTVASNASLNYAMQAQYAVPMHNANIQVQGNSAPIFGVAVANSSQAMPQQPLKDTTSHASFPLDSVHPNADPVSSHFAQDPTIPSAADLCQGFSDDEDDHAFKNQLHGLADPQPVSLWSSVLGLFRPQAHTAAHGNEVLSGNMNSTVQQQASNEELAHGFTNHFMQHGMQGDLHQPGSYATAASQFASPGWQATASPHEQLFSDAQAQEQDLTKVASSAAFGLVESITRSPPPPSQMTDYTERSSPGSTTLRPTTTTSLSPVDADWYSW